MVQRTVNNFLKYYEVFESRPVFETVDEMLNWAGLHKLTTRTLQEELVDVGLSPLLIQELVTVRPPANFLYELYHFCVCLLVLFMRNSLFSFVIVVLSIMVLYLHEFGAVVSLTELFGQPS